MAKITIRYFTGDVEERELSRTLTISIGRRPSNDICIDEDDVGPMHCRIAWNRTGYEVVAAMPQGVEVNGTLVQHAMLSQADVIRVGTVDISVALDASEAGRKKAGQPVAAGSSAVLPSMQSMVALPHDLFEDEPDRESEPRKPSRAEKRGRPADRPPLDDDSDGYVPTAAVVPDSETEDPFVDEGTKSSPAAAERDKNSLSAKLRRRLHSARPGDEEIIRSKFLISLIVGMGVLLLIAAVLWVWYQRNAAERHFEKAQALQKEQKYKQAIDVYTEFLKIYPKTNQFTNDVIFARADARVEQHLSGSVPNWQLALDAAKEYRKETRNLDGYAEKIPTIGGYAEKIALGAVATAEKTRDRKYLPVAKAAHDYALQFKVTAEFEKSYENAYRKAEATVLREEHFKAAEANITAALAKGDISSALQSRLDFLQFIQGFAAASLLRHEQRSLSKLLVKTMDKERSAITATVLDRNAETKDRPERTLPARSLTLQSRPKDGLTSDRSQLVVGLAKGSCYGLDSVTGEPVWRRVIGPGRAFFPVAADVRVKSLLMFDTHFGELLLVEQLTGKLAWRQPLRNGKTPEQAAGEPLVHGGQIFLATTANSLYQIDLESGRIKAKLRFSQPVQTPVVAPDNERLVVLGDKALAYTLRLNPNLSCERVDYVGHRSGSVRAPLMRIGKLVLMCENIGADSCRLRVLNTSGKGTWLGELTFSAPGKQIRVDGQVIDKPAPIVADKPVLRKNHLFVSSTGERVTVFTVSDETERPQAERNEHQFLSPLARYSSDQSRHSGPIYLVAGPNGQLWMASDRLRKFHLKTKVIVRDDEETAFGRATQPPQVLSDNIYLGRQSGFSRSVSITQHDRTLMDRGRWRTVLGSAVIAWHAFPKSNLIACLNEDGHVFRVTPDELAAGGFSQETSRRLRGAKSFIDPIRAVALPGGQFVAVANGPDESLIWIVDPAQRQERVVRSPRPVQADPIALGTGVVLPLQGRLRYINLQLGGSPYEDFEVPFAKNQKQPPRWQQLVALSKTEFLALDAAGRLRRIQLRADGGRRYLGMAMERLLPKPSGQGVAAMGSNVIVANSAGLLEVLNSATLQSSASVKLDGRATNAVWAVGSQIFVEVGFRKLVCYRLGNGLEKAWELPLSDAAGLAASPSPVGNSLLVTERNGTLHLVDARNGKPQKTWTLAQPVSGVPRLVGDVLIVPTDDGSLYSLKFSK